MQEQLLTKRLEDMAQAALASGKMVFGDFYEEHIRMLIEREITRYEGVGVSFWGGQDFSLRQMLCVHTLSCEVAPKDFPLGVLWVKAKTPLLHPQVMGALLGLGIEVGKVGDISVLDDKVQITVAGPLLAFVEQNLEKVDRYAVSVCAVPPENVILTRPNLKEISAVVASLRLDGIVAECFHLSRSVATAFVKGEKVRVNHAVVKKPSYLLKPGDLVSVSSKGRFVFAKSTGQTKKGNMKIVIQKFV